MTTYDSLVRQAASSIGTVESVLDNGDLRVRYSTKKIWTINSECVSKVGDGCNGDWVSHLHSSRGSIVLIPAPGEVML